MRTGRGNSESGEDEWLAEYTSRPVASLRFPNAIEKISERRVDFVLQHFTIFLFRGVDPTCLALGGSFLYNNSTCVTWHHTFSTLTPKLYPTPEPSLHAMAPRKKPEEKASANGAADLILRYLRKLSAFACTTFQHGKTQIPGAHHY